MNDHWRNRLGNVASQKLEALWETMAVAFSEAIAGRDSTRPRWRVLAPPTGTGKTEGVKVYASLLAKANRVEALHDQVGVLLVTRQITQADDLADSINKMAGADCAVAWHSRNHVNAEAAFRKDVVAITHSAFVRALSSDSSSTRKWDQLLQWRGGLRSLVVIDEALDDLVEQFQVTGEDVRLLLGHISERLRDEFPSAMAALETVMNTFLEAERMARRSKSANLARFVWRQVADRQIVFPRIYSTKALSVALAESLRLKGKRQGGLELEVKIDALTKTMRGCEAILSGWAWYAQRGVAHTFNTARLVVPFEAIGPVVLDATASQNMLWELMGDHVIRTDAPADVRSYRNVTLHVGYADRVGKTASIDQGKTRLPILFQSLEAALGHDRRVLVCLHKGIEHIAAGLAPAFEFDVAHWGDIDGKNQWNQFDAVAILSLPYRDDVWATNMFCELQGLPENSWMNRPHWRDYDNVREVMQQKQIAVSVIQAINRVRCRRVIDEFGNCPATDVFILLPRGTIGESLLQALRVEMPGLQTVGWDCALDKAKAPVRKGSSHDALRILMINRPSGIYPMKEIEGELGLNKETGKSLRSALRDDTHPLTIAMREIGVTHLSDGKGRRAMPRLVKIDRSR